jgi:hypothetical protein
MTQTLTLENKDWDAIAYAVACREVELRRSARAVVSQETKGILLDEASRVRISFDALTMARAK